MGIWAKLFGKKEEPTTKQEQAPQKEIAPQQKKQLEADNQWLYEFLIQYLTSPVWKIPIYEFIDQNCIIFDDEEENKFEYTTIHKQFKDQIEAMVQQLMIDVGINEEQFYQMCMMGLKNKHHRKIFEQILIVDNFLVFKKLMVKRNKELELEALKQLDEDDSKTDSKVASKSSEKESQMKQKQLEQEKSELELAIAMSMAASEEQSKYESVEDEELQKALLQSQASFQEEQVKKSQIKEQEEKALSDSKMAQQKAAQKVEETKKPVEEAKPAPVVQQKKEESPKKQEQQTKKPDDDVKKELSKLSSLPPLKASSNLPPLVMQPKYEKPVDALLKQKESLEEQLKVYKNVDDQLKNAKVPEKEESKEEESLEDRKKRLLAQRELLRKKKQKQREEELKRFQELENAEEGNQDKKQDLAKQQSIALDLEKTMPNQSHISPEERQKRANLYSKIKTNLE